MTYVEIQAQYQKIQAILKKHSTKLVAVSKGQPVSKIEYLYGLGQRDFGENYVQEMTEKVQLLQEKGIRDIQWHFLGHLQKNKIRKVLPHLTYLHSLDSVALAEALEKECAQLNRSLKVFIEVNLDQQDSKTGFLESDLVSVKNEFHKFSHLEVQGLMVIPNPDLDSKLAFQRAAELNQTLGFSALSMGMSDDFEEAIQAGSSWVRIGSLLMGARS